MQPLKRLVRHIFLICVLSCLAACASISTSDTHVSPVGDYELHISARAERGASRDHLFIVVNGVDVADSPFGPAQASGVLLRGQFEELPVEATCGHRWKPGMHIGYRCVVHVGGGDPVELDF